jgi:hypothetical protein
MTTKGKTETRKFRSYRITTQKSKPEHSAFKGRIRVNPTKGTRRATRR